MLPFEKSCENVRKASGQDVNKQPATDEQLISRRPGREFGEPIRRKAAQTNQRK